MARGRLREDKTTLQMALVGYRLEKIKIEEKIREVQNALGVNGTSAAPGVSAPKRKKLSAAARRRIAAAQRRRWAEHRKKVAAAKG
jgi:hypothetical protein